MIQKRFSNGLRAISAKTDGHVTYAGVLVKAGSRDDGRGKDGLAHFVEHTIFKGTPRRSTWQVSNRLETVGGELNAYTTKEHIMLYSVSPEGYENRALDLLADLATNARFPAEETEREKGVVIEEINSYSDNAGYAVFDEFDELFFAGTPLAHNILGYADTVEKLTSEDASHFLRTRFVPEQMVVYCVTPGDPERNMRLLEKYFSPLDREAVASDYSPIPVAAPFDETRDRGNRQANTLMGVRTVNVHDPARYALWLMSSILGGAAMNSRLNRELRDRRGLVYSVETNVTLLEDAGMFQVYFGTDPKNVERCTRIVRKELERLADSRMSDTSFRNAKRQLCGQLLVSGDSRSGNAMRLAKSLMRYGEILDRKHDAMMIESLDAETLRSMAESIASTPYSRLTIL